MSTLITRLNAIKLGCDLSWRTPSQAEAWAALHERLALGEVVNLHGPAGSGKTFLAWLLVKEQGASYAPSLAVAIPLLADSTTLPVIDNQRHTRDAYRNLLKQLAFHGRTRAVMISRAPVQDDCFHVPLTLTQDDKSVVTQRLRELELSCSPRTSGSLHHLINPHLPL